jgi:beta-mannosidase
MVERYNNVTAGSIYGDSGTRFIFCFIPKSLLILSILDYYNYDATQAFNVSSYPIARFANEFGFHSQPSYQTWSSSIPASELHFNSSTILSRNHHYPLNASDFLTSSLDPPVPENQTERSLGGMGQLSQAASLYFPVARKQDARANFAAQIYTTQIFQSVFDRAQIAAYRRGSGQPQRTLGALYWQLNDIWAAPTWASLEVGGRWKLLHYGARDIYNPVIVAPYFDAQSGVLDIWVTSDLWNPIQGSARVMWYDWSGNRLANGTETAVHVGPINSTSVWTLNTTALPFALDNAVAILSVDATGENGKQYNHTHPFYPIPFSSDRVQQNLHDPKLSLSYSAEKQTFTVESKAVAAWVWLEHPVGVRGYFTDNGFWMLPGKRDVRFVTQRDSTAGEWVHEVVISSLWDLTQP